MNKYNYTLIRRLENIFNYIKNIFVYLDFAFFIFSAFKKTLILLNPAAL